MADDDDSKWLKYGAPTGIGALIALGGFLVGRSFAVPLATTFWDLAAQPLATGAAGAGAIGAGLLALHNGAKTRALEGTHHRQTMDRDRESNLRDRYTAAAKQLGDDNSAVREAGAYAIAALADDWLRYGSLIEDRGLAHSQTRACVNLLCSYLRANRHDDDNMDMGFSREESAVRSSIVGIIRERNAVWHRIEKEWTTAERPLESSPIRIDLSGASLMRENFAGADLSGALLLKTDFRRANLRNANLEGAQLAGANLRAARLIRANFQRAVINHAEFDEALAWHADFTGAFGSAVSFEDARLRGAIFAAANLRRAKFDRAREIEHAVFDFKTRYDDKTVWPEGFTPRQARKIVTVNRVEQIDPV